MKLAALGVVLVSAIAWAQVPQSKHVWVLTEENHSYEATIGNSSMPYFNLLANKYGLATQYYSEQHNSISALMWLVSGQPITGNNSTTTCYNVNNLGRQLIAQAYKWRSYQEDLPYAGFEGISNLNYVRRHNPIIDFTDTCAASQKINSVPYTQLATDIANHTTPNFAYITPNLTHDAHNGTLAAADEWMSQHLPAILALPEFQPGGDGILFIVWDEADLSSDGYTQDNRCSSNISSGCGGRLATLVIGPQVKPHYRSTTRYDHANLLTTICAAMGLSTCPGAGSVENPMSDFFNTVNISTPFANAAVASPVRIQATTSNNSPVHTMQLYVDNVLKYQVADNSIDTSLPIPAGKHFVVAQSWDSAGGIHKRGIYVNVQSQAVVVTNPAPREVVGSEVQVGAIAGGQSKVSKMQLYVDGNSQFQSSGNTLNTSISLSAGNHTLNVEAADSAGNLASNKFSVTSARPSIHILSPASPTGLLSPIFVSASSIDPSPVRTIQIYEDHNLIYQVTGTGVQATIPMSVGQHLLAVQAWNTAGQTYKQTVNLNVIGVPITISSPKPNATVDSPVTITASAPGSSTVRTMQIYIDDKMLYQVSAKTVSHSFALSSGQHKIVAKGWDANGVGWFSTEFITVK
ncbi:MAG TPA: alkaline phosphatase family protein [Terriglobales bacterium]|jgi:acid phosphatase|nr:alkaline phosphatase family protein [Terriglobales bacterium]